MASTGISNSHLACESPARQGYSLAYGTIRGERIHSAYCICSREKENLWGGPWRNETVNSCDCCRRDD